ncbi:hypothetical protein ACJ73_07451 [Blastomyces percursus]|uniref:Uncharacterized protein n=1 Tax=Blastomyces percursus TaxID=1658174 RepID=A0A1J9PY04_9EURO|nr:hypothetical protein ACJ73_07451 [Blastomyces percursus]
MGDTACFAHPRFYPVTPYAVDCPLGSLASVNFRTAYRELDDEYPQSLWDTTLIRITTQLQEIPKAANSTCDPFIRDPQIFVPMSSLQ